MTSSSSKKRNSTLKKVLILLSIIILLAFSPTIFRNLEKNIGLASAEESYEMIYVSEFEKTHSHGRRTSSDTDFNHLTKFYYQDEKIVIHGRTIYEALQPYQGKEVEALIETRTYWNGTQRFEVLEIVGIPQSQFNAGILSNLLDGTIL